ETRSRSIKVELRSERPLSACTRCELRDCAAAFRLRKLRLVKAITARCFFMTKLLKTQVIKDNFACSAGRRYECSWVTMLRGCIGGVRRLENQENKGCGQFSMAGDAVSCLTGLYAKYPLTLEHDARGHGDDCASLSCGVITKHTADRRPLHAYHLQVDPQVA